MSSATIIGIKPSLMQVSKFGIRLTITVCFRAKIIVKSKNFVNSPALLAYGQVRLFVIINADVLSAPRTHQINLLQAYDKAQGAKGIGDLGSEILFFPYPFPQTFLFPYP